MKTLEDLTVEVKLDRLCSECPAIEVEPIDGYKQFAMGDTILASLFLEIENTPGSHAFIMNLREHVGTGRRFRLTVSEIPEVIAFGAG